MLLCKKGWLHMTLDVFSTLWFEKSQIILFQYIEKPLNAFFNLAQSLQ